MADAGSVMCANGSQMQTTAKAMNGEIPTTYLTNCDSHLISMGEVCDVTGKDFVVKSNGAWLSKQPAEIKTEDKDCFEKLSSRQPGTNQTYLIEPATANAVLKTRFRTTRRRFGRSFVNDKAQAISAMNQNLETAKLSIMEANPGSTIQARLCGIPGRRIARLIRSGRISGIQEDPRVIENLVVGID